MESLALCSKFIMEKFVTSIKKKYIERLTTHEKQWLPCYSTKLVSLQLVERMKGEGYFANNQRGRQSSRRDEVVKRSHLAYDDLFKVESEKPVRRIVVEGDAGIGKTSFCTSVSVDWANGDLFQEFQLLLFLPLRQKRFASTASLFELLRLLHSSESVCNSVANYVEEEEGAKVLIVADGWDELSESKRGEESFLYQLFFYKFPFMSVILTSRPSASAPLHGLPYIDRFIEVHGFNKDNIKEYIQLEFSNDQEKADRLLEQLEKDPLVESVCSIPLSCAIICHLWRSCEEALPTTLTELYTKMILNIVFLDIKRTDAYKDVLSLADFDTLPESLQDPWWDLCKFAFFTLKKQQTIFSQKELVDFFPQGTAVDKKIHCFGLLQSAESVFDVGHGVSFHFLHLVFQEYLAALYLVKQTTDEQIKICHSSVSVDFCMIWRFFIGIHFGSKKQALMKYNPVKGVITDVLENLHWKRCFIAHCAYEAKGNITSEIDEVLRKFPLPSFHPFNEYDYASIVHVIKCQQYSATVIDLEYLNLSDSRILELAYALQDSERCDVKDLRLSGNKLTGMGIKNLFDIGFDVLRSVSILRLSYNPLRKSGLKAIKKAVNDSMLSELIVLELCGCADQHSVLKLARLINSVLVNCRYLQILDLSDNPLDTEGAQALGDTISKCSIAQKSESNHNESMQSVESSTSNSTDNLVLDEAQEVTVGDDDEPCKVQRLTLSLNGTNLGDSEVNCFVGKDFIYLQKLELKRNNICAGGVSCIADNIALGKLQVNCLCLDDNPIGLEGFVALGKMFGSEYCQVTELSLSRCLETLLNNDESNIYEQFHHLSLSPTQDQSLVHLTLNDNYLAERNIHIVGGFLCISPRMQVLQCNRCKISSNEIDELMKKHIHSTADRHPTKIRMWTLVGNSIDDHGVSSIITNLKFFPDAVSIDLDDNPVSNKKVSELKKALRNVSLSHQNAEVLVIH